MSVSAIIVTRGDVDLSLVLKSLPREWEKIVWDNGAGTVRRWPSYAASGTDTFQADDLGVYGRYAAIEYARHDLCFVQDDDCVVGDPARIADEWRSARIAVQVGRSQPDDFVVCNMPREFRHSFYYGHSLVGFGSCFHRDAPERAFSRFRSWRFTEEEIELMRGPWFQRTCDIVFTALTPRVLVDVPYENLPWADDPSRMYQQPDHVGERQRMLDMVRAIQ